MPKKVLEQLMKTYTAYCQSKIVDLSIVPSKAYAVLDTEPVAMSGSAWPDTWIFDKDVLEHVVVFKLQSTKDVDPLYCIS